MPHQNVPHHVETRQRYDPRPIVELKNRRVTLMGLGRHGGGVSAARWLASRGALVTVTDSGDEMSLAASRLELVDVPIAKFQFGGHREEDFCSAEMVVVNPAVRPDHPLVVLARDSGAQVTSEIELFLRACPAPILGVTGTTGKSTTAAMIAAACNASFSTSGRQTWLGGNIGRSLLPELDYIAAEDWVVLELSSFQLHWLGRPVRPIRIAVVTNFAPNHLDWHPDCQHYRAAKQRLIACQGANDWTVLSTRDSELHAWRDLVRGKLAPGVPPGDFPELAIAGEHQRNNASLAAAAAMAAGCSWAQVRKALAEFRGLPHRLELVNTVAGRRFYNDSKATTPEAVVAALATAPGPIWLLAGGIFKSGDCSALADAIAKRAKGACFFGSAADLLHEHVSQSAGCLPAARQNFATRDTLSEALAWCWRRSQPGESIVLAPGCASFDQFRDYEHRGNVFTDLVRAIDL